MLSPFFLTVGRLCFLYAAIPDMHISLFSRSSCLIMFIEYMLPSLDSALIYVFGLFCFIVVVVFFIFKYKHRLRAICKLSSGFILIIFGAGFDQVFLPIKCCK